jgi:hypothetical protein
VVNVENTMAAGRVSYRYAEVLSAELVRRPKKWRGVVPAVMAGHLPVEAPAAPGSFDQQTAALK